MKLLALLSAVLSGVLGVLLVQEDNGLMVLAFASSLISLIILGIPKSREPLGSASYAGSLSSPPVQVQHVGQPLQTVLNDEQQAIVRTHVRSGDKILAVKKIREWTGLGLMEAKNLADSFDSGR